MFRREKRAQHIASKLDLIARLIGERHSILVPMCRNMQYIGTKSGEAYVAFDPRYLRPAEVDVLIGDASKARKQLGWTPTTKFPELVRILVDADIALLERQRDGKDIRM